MSQHKCKVCKRALRETKMSKCGTGPLKEMRCPKCKVILYVNR